jgi:hypothetical protein
LNILLKSAADMSLICEGSYFCRSLRISINSDRMGTMAEHTLRPTKRVPMVTRIRESGSPSKELGPRQAFWTIIKMKEIRMTVRLEEYLVKKELKGAAMT